jgi:flavin-dependent dehydrogenase
VKLRNGDRIAVIGAGPAGTFFAYLARDAARRRGEDISVTIFDGKDFEQPGPPGCNMCAGVISETLSEKLHHIGLSPPANRVQVAIEKYNLSTPYHDISLYKRRRRFPIYTVYRGNGPRGLLPAENVSFDDHLLDECRKKGVAVMPQMVRDIILPQQGDEPVKLHYGKNGEIFEAHLLVIACGLNTRFLEKLATLGFGYRPPKMVYTCQAEIPMPDDFIRAKMGSGITTFALERSDIRFAAFTPKQHHLTLTIIGKRDVTLKDLEAVLRHPKIRDDFLQGVSLNQPYCFCRPKIAVGPARGVFTDRLVIIGDAAFSRYYKNGIESAFDTARLAARCAVEKGVSAQDFRRYYLCGEAKAIRNSSRYGKFLFKCYDVIFHSRLLTDSLISLLEHRAHGFTSQQMIKILWGISTGNIAYKKILGILSHPRLQLRMTLETVRVLSRKLSPLSAKLEVHKVINREVDPLGPLGSGQTVAIIGGGPAGAGCALALKKFAAARDLDVKVVIYEGKDFETQPHYNQCVGVLSPPIIQILERELGVPFPYHLSQRQITGYVLHSDHRALVMPGEDEPSISVRRVTFDNYLLQQAQAKGAEVIHSRVTDIEFGPEGVMLYSETDNRRADVVVGAFGLDDGSAKIFERVTKYRQPRFLNSIVTKVHPGEDIVAHFENSIHAFLPSRREIEFGAVTPKKNHLTINVAGSDVTAQSLHDFLNMPEVRKVLPVADSWSPDGLACFKGKFPIHVARGFYGNRHVIIGDAAGLLRPFKGKGVNMGILTGMRAARTMLDVGIGKRAFEDFEAKCHDITGDLPYGKLMRFVAVRIANWKILDGILAVAETNEKLRRALFDSVSAHQSYKNILRDSWDFRLFVQILGSVIGSILHRRSNQVTPLASIPNPGISPANPAAPKESLRPDKEGE